MKRKSLNQPSPFSLFPVLIDPGAGCLPPPSHCLPYVCPLSIRPLSSLPPPEHSEIHFSTLETRSRISSFQSHASRQDREFLSYGLVLRDEIENFCLMVSCFETRSRIYVFWSHASRRERDFLCSCFLLLSLL